MNPISRTALIEFELVCMDLAESLDIKDKNDLEWFSATLHEHLEIAMQDYAHDGEIEDYEAQY